MRRTLLLLAGLMQFLFVNAQKKYDISGIVNDSSGQVLIGANVWIVMDKDSIHTITDEQGVYYFDVVLPASFTIKVTMIGYETLCKKYNYLSSFQTIQLPAIVMNIQSNSLKEVIIKSKVSPVKLKDDTIEFSVSQYHLRENAQLDDLLKRLPGMELDKNGNIKFMGQAVTQIRINGRDFTVGNIKDFLRLIPLEYIDKLQLAEDHGKVAALTGRTTGDANKLINIETKKDIDINRLKIVGARGNKQRYNAQVNISTISKKKQIIIDGILNNTSPGSGETINKTGTLVYRNQLNDYFLTSSGFFIEKNDIRNEVVSSLSSQTTDGNFYNNNSSSILNSTENYSLTESLEYKDNKKNNLTFLIIGRHNNQTEKNNTQSIQTGVQHVEQSITETTNSQAPSLTTNLYGSHIFKRPGETLVFGANIDYVSNSTTSQTLNHSLFFKSDNSISTDSILLQKINMTSKIPNILLLSSFVYPLNEKLSGEVKYFINSKRNATRKITEWEDSEGKIEIIDSLSNNFNYNILEQQAGTNIKFKGKTLEVVTGINLINAIYSKNHTTWLVPEIHAVYNFTKHSRLKAHYEAHPAYPEFVQLNPIPDRTNPLNPKIGNPKLYAGLNHVFMLDYRHTGNNMLLIKFRFNPIIGQTATNTTLSRDTLNNIIQETHYININGNYTIYGNYSWSHSFTDGKYQVFINGSCNLNNNVFLLEGSRNATKNLVITQSVRGGIYQKWIELNATAGYGLNHTSYSNNQISSANIRTYNLILNTKLFTRSSWSLSLDINKQFNSGYANGVVASPTDLSTAIEKVLFKNKLSFRLQGFNLLNQNTGISQTISANTTTQTRTNQLGRYILLSAILDLKKTKK